VNWIDPVACDRNKAPKAIGRKQELVMSIEPRITLVTLGVRDVLRASIFYEALGWRKSSMSNLNVAFFHLNGTVLSLYGRAALAEDAGVEDSEPGFSGVTLAHNLESEFAVDMAFNVALSCGARSVKRPQKAFWGGYSGYFADPDGHLWELAHNPFAPLDENGNMVLPD
jgi:uncharacterized protein